MTAKQIRPNPTNQQILLAEITHSLKRAKLASTPTEASQFIKEAQKGLQSISQPKTK